MAASDMFRQLKQKKDKKKDKPPSNVSTSLNVINVNTLLKVVGGIVSIIVVLLAVMLARNNSKSNTAGEPVDAVMQAETSHDFSTVVAPKGANPEGRPRVADRECMDRYDTCKQFLKQGECEKNPGWMIINCPKSCKSCHLRDPTLRCDRENLNMSTSPIYNPGDMERMFADIELLYPHFGITVLSRDPWIVTFDNFLTNEESDALISNTNNWERSTDSGETNEYGETGRILSQGRTSSNSWCTAKCNDHPDVQSIISKITEITRVPYDNYESFQVLRYEIGQKYNTHHDYGKEDTRLACGPRILTFFLYLSDVEDGGETSFPSLNITVTPKKGKALLWPSTMDNDLEKQDGRTVHQAKAVNKGVKYAANTWIHLFNYKTPNLWGCTGAFDEL